MRTVNKRTVTGNNFIYTNQVYTKVKTKVKHLGVSPSRRCRHVQYFNAWVP